jgi:SAM-dependent methyltransferase
VNTSINEEQEKLWNGCAGAAWVESQETLDQLFRPFEDSLTQAVISAGATRVLDVGCGTGATTLAISRALARTAGAKGRSVGVDISRPMIDLARRRAAREEALAEFIVGDAQTQEFAPASFDMFVSRFGVMFFGDPVRAFANLRRGAAPGAVLRCQVFRSPAENPFMTAAERAAAPLLPGLPPRKTDGPGQFAFADARKVEVILEASGWGRIEIEPIDVTCAMPERALDQYMRRLGPVGQVLRDADEDLRTRVAAAVRAGFTPYLRGGEVRFTAACWEIAARV